MEAEKYKELLSQQLSVDSDWGSCIYDLLSPKGFFKGQDSFESALLRLNKYLNADYLFVARINKKEGALDIVASNNSEKISPSLPLLYEHTPCEHAILAESSITYCEDVMVKFPRAKTFKELNVEAYSGITLCDSSNNPIGVLAALFCNKIDNPGKVEALMFMCSSLMGRELEHSEALKQASAINSELQSINKALISKNDELNETIHELKKVTLKVEESDKLKTSFLANLSHEVRTPMNAIIGFTELLKSNDLNPEERNEYLDIVHQNGNQLMRVMDALIDISKLQTKVHVKDKERVSVNSLILKLNENYTQELSVMQKPIKLNLLLGKDDGKDVLSTHKEPLCKIFEHLIGNAIKFTSKGDIYIGYTVGNGYFEFFVKDSGVGIPVGQEEQIFDLFRQVDVGHCRAFGGNGIGLSIVQRYVEIMGGKVWAEPNQTEGALFKFIIPIA